MAREIITKFKSCFEEDTLTKETIVFKGEDGTEQGQVSLRQLTSQERDETAGKPYETLLKAIESWTLKDKEGKLLDLTLENLKKLSSLKKIDNVYDLGIIDNLFKVIVEMNFVTEQDEKNSVKP